MARIAFFTLNAYDMLTGGHTGEALGGAQLQQILVGKELARRGHDIYFVEYDSDNKQERHVDGITVITKPRPTGSELKRATTVLHGTHDVIREINPDVCYRRSLDFEILPLSVYGLLGDTRFVYGISHDAELTDSPRKFASGIKSTAPYIRLNQYALSNADAVIAQNPTQYELAVQRLDTEVHEIPNCYPAEQSDPIDWEYQSPVVFWAARFDSWKNPGLVADLAEELPEITFVMAGGPGDETLVSQLQKRAQDIENLEVIGHVPIAEIDRYFAAADVFLNTSTEEGFPNTFLQAWANKTPVVSYQVDPNDVLHSEEIGLVANGSMAQLRENIDLLAESQEKRETLGQMSWQYLCNYHSIESIADKYEQVFNA